MATPSADDRISEWQSVQSRLVKPRSWLLLVRCELTSNAYSSHDLNAKAPNGDAYDRLDGPVERAGFVQGDAEDDNSHYG